MGLDSGFPPELCRHLTAGLSYRPYDDDFDMEEELKKLHPSRPPRQPELEPRSRRGLVGDSRVGVIPEGRGDSEDEESDSDGPILYRDDDDDEDVPISKIEFKLLDLYKAVHFHTDAVCLPFQVAWRAVSRGRTRWP